MHDIYSLTGNITRVYIKEITLNEPFIDFAGRFAHMPGTVVLLSGGNSDCARYHMLGSKPWLCLSGRNNYLIIESNGNRVHIKENPFSVLKKIITAFNIKSKEVKNFQSGFPCACGLFGYFSYDLKNCLEKLPKTTIDRFGLPHILLYAPSIIVVHDKIENTTKLIIPERNPNGASTLENDLGFFSGICSGKSALQGDFSGDKVSLKSNFTKENYIASINQIKEYIASGHVYQVNMSQRFETDFSGDPYNLFKTLFNMNPAPFFAYINAGDHQIVSTSPERFLHQTERKVETRPIKGTRPRGKTNKEDRLLKLELSQSKKDDAELSMIVDLLRNDIGKVCEAGSVHVFEHKRIEEYKNVFHLVSIVKGTLDKRYDSVDLIKATFPGGSITGCPKIRAMEIIDEMEPDSRHIYTGSIGYISFHDTMDLSIAIRTAIIYKDKIIFSVGGGIVFDSDPEDEFDETLHKGRTLMDVFKGKSAGYEKHQALAWLNGSIVPLTAAKFDATDLGIQYGYGFFETIRVNKGKIKLLHAHIRRFEKTWKTLFLSKPPDLTWDKIIINILEKNYLDRTTAAVKILATMGSPDSAVFIPNLIVTARPYTHRLKEKNIEGLFLGAYPYPRMTPLADHKTSNYLYYYLAGKWAKEKGFDEALILNPDGTLSETNTANLLLVKEKKVVWPVSPHVLPGVMQKAVCDVLAKWGYAVKKARLYPLDIFSFEDVFITNSLVGAVPALGLDGKKLKTPTDLWKKINQKVL